MRWTEGGRGGPDVHPGGAEVAPPGDGVPFAPIAPRPITAVSMAQRAYGWAQRFRFPVGIAFNVLIVGAAFVAFTVSQNAGAENGGVESSGVGALAASGDSGVQEPGQSTDGGGVGNDGGGDRSDGRRASGSFETDVDPTSSSVPETSDGTSPTPAPTSNPAQVQALDRRVVPASIDREAEGSSGDETTTSAVTTSSTPTTPSTSARSTTSTTSSTQPTTTVTATTSPPKANIGDQVRADDGRGLSGVGVTLRRDAGGSGRIASATTDGGGNYGFTVEPGCYVVIFALPDGASVVSGNQQQRVCVDGGQRLDTVDLTVRFAPQVAAPPACDVQTGNNPYAGVEIRDSNRAWAPGYVFYGQSGNVIVRTRNLGPPDDTTNPDRNQIEWTSSRYGFEESDVYAVAAEDENGNVSGRVTCSRRSV
ncbi:MAG: hypothetical protein ACR2QO_11085 [Acidimicrobiales bacterium]